MAEGELAGTQHGADDGKLGRAKDAVRDRLMQARAAVSRGGRNVNDVERALSAVGGLALLGLALRRRTPAAILGGVAGAMLLKRGATGHCEVYGALGVSTADDGPVQQHGESAVLDASKATKVEHSVTVARPRAELFRYWRALENLPSIMSHLESVEVIDARRSRWVAKAPAGQHVEWEAEIINEVPDGLIAWRSAKDATVPNAGSVHFTSTPDGNGTEVRVVLEYQPPAGKAGQAAAKLFREEPDTQVREDLQRFKRAMEAGEGAAVVGSAGT